MRRIITAAVVSAAVFSLIGTIPAAAQDEPLAVAVTVDGQDIAGRTVTIDPAKPVELGLTAINRGTAPVRVRSVRVSGVALALTFFSYDTTIPFEVPAGARVTRTLVLDLAELDGQAMGLLPGSVELLDADRELAASAALVTDIRGSFWSVYGIFGLAVLSLTALAWATALLALARHRLPRSRARRALRFLPAGFGTGLTAVVTLSVLRVMPPEPALEVPVVLGAAAIALLLGYLTPHTQPDNDTDTIPLTTRPIDSATEGYAG
ncbi:hypothetical protein [Amycolatopsis sp. YIM 10]|uniref:hypothetical protein n=1 Tax=Amycolatopsis sp. YIM 10 TaxID=2653857 RepID=UPI00129006F0|nr:hypothetical protein [Amycolatopsis sp. YIM 10]QFU94340.1 hypothetical protein YIM_46070 [Amycolatopsis sp. YIM 10]